MKVKQSNAHVWHSLVPYSTIPVQFRFFESIHSDIRVVDISVAGAPLISPGHNDNKPASVEIT